MRAKKVVFKKGDVFVLPGFVAFGVAINKNEGVMVRQSGPGIPQTSRGPIPPEAMIHTLNDSVMVSFYTIAAINAARLAITGHYWF